MKKYLILIFYLTLWISALSCDCKDIRNLKKEQKRSFKQHELIFIGKVTASDKGGYQFKVIELLKGSIEDSTFNGEPMDFCSTAPNAVGETWLVYTDVLPNGTIDISDCGFSRSYRFPFHFGSSYLPPPPPRNAETADVLDHEVKVFELRKKALMELRSEIEQLRRWK